MNVVHTETDTVLADTVETGDTHRAKLTGLRFRRRFPDGHALHFPFDATRRRAVDMLFVPFAIDVCWLIDDRVERVTTLRPWMGVGLARADAILELPAGTASDVSAGDRLHVDSVEPLSQ